MSDWTDIEAISTISASSEPKPQAPRAPVLCAAPTPGGALRLLFHPAEEAWHDELSPALSSRLLALDEQGPPYAWLIELGASELHTALPPGLSFWRDLAVHLLSAACRAEGPGLALPFPSAEAERWLLAAPPMFGGEYLSIPLLRAVWHASVDTLRALSEGAARDYLASRGALWSQVGRVFFHLAENPANPDLPFAFLATYTDRIHGGGPKHRPLADALRLYASEDRQADLQALLAPVQRAATRSTLVRDLVSLGDIFHPLSWTPDEAYRLLSEQPQIEEAGILVRVPDWWQSRPHPTVRVTVGEEPPGALGASALLDFSYQIALGDQPLTNAEWEALRQQQGKLVRLRGRWVELDAKRLNEALEQFKAIERQARRGGISFFEGMRLLSGIKATSVEELPGAEWAEVRPGAWLKQVTRGLQEPAQLRSGVVDRVIQEQLKATPRPYQQAGARWLFLLARLGFGACLADDMGLGKTLQVLALFLAARESGQQRHLVVAPASLLANWRQEIQRFAPSLGHYIAHPGFTDARQLAAEPSAEVTITSYSMLARLPHLLSTRWDTVVLDEAQAIKNPNTKQSRAVKELKSQARIALTGTPIENRLADLWSIFDFLNPGLLGTDRQFQEFVRRLEARPKDTYAPLRSLIKPYLLRRLKTDKAIISDLPDKTEVKAYCALSKAQAALYQNAVDELKQRLNDVEEGIQRRGLIFSYLMRFKQICNHPAQWLGGEYNPSQSGKFRRLAELAETLAARQEKILVFTQFQELTGPLVEFLTPLFGRPGLRLDGQTPVSARPGLVARFQDDPQVPFFVLSLKAGGSGLNLTAATQVIHFDRWWNPAVENQATDRAYRIGQKKNVLVHKFICRGTLEDKIDAMLESKSQLSQEVLSEAEAPMLSEMSNEEILRAVSLDLGAALEEEVGA